jgi:hypothetical protein
MKSDGTRQSEMTQAVNRINEEASDYLRVCEWPHEYPNGGTLPVSCLVFARHPYGAYGMYGSTTSPPFVSV